MRRLTKILGAAALLAGGSSLCSAAPTTPTGAATATASASFTQDEVKRYASAMAELQRLNQLVATREGTVPAEQRPALEQEADQQRRGILQHYALDPTTFNAISKAVETDPALNERVRQAVMASLLGP
jgi:ABC-type sugar transport system substrate-binding protein